MGERRKVFGGVSGGGGRGGRRSCPAAPGGLLALWLASNRPEPVSGIVLEDASVFSVEMPRFRDEDRFVYEGLKRTVKAIGDPNDRDLAGYFKE